MNFPDKVETDRLAISRFQAGDITDCYLKWLNDKEKMKFSNQRFYTHSRGSCLDYLASFDQINKLFLAIKLKSNGTETELLGTSTVYFSPEHNTADVGLLIGLNGQGFGSEAWNAIISELLEQGIRKITAGCVEHNYAMRAIATKAGMQIDCVKSDQEILDGVPTDIIYYALFRT